MTTIVVPSLAALVGAFGAALAIAACARLVAAVGRALARARGAPGSRH